MNSDLHVVPVSVGDNFFQHSCIDMGLMDKGEKRLSPEESKLFALLANLLEDYEAHSLPPLERTSPAETLSLLMEQNDLRQEDLADIFGSQGGVSKVITGKREISKAQAKRLAERFKVSTDAFI